MTTWKTAAPSGVSMKRWRIQAMTPSSTSTTPTATAVAVAVVLVELLLIAWIRHRFMDTPLLPAVLQVVVGGALVFLAGILIGSS